MWHAIEVAHGDRVQCMVVGHGGGHSGGIQSGVDGEDDD